MAATLSDNGFTYDALDSWEQLPDGARLVETPGVAVMPDDSVILLTRNTEHPVMHLAREGEWLGSWGRGVFTDRAHGVWIGREGDIWCADDGTHIITRWSPEGELLQTIGDKDAPAPIWSGRPFNRPTHAAVSPRTGDIFITDGYGNSRVHRFSADGAHKLSWGEPGIDAGQFIRPHNIAIDEDGLIYVADRECHRVQVFSESGTFVAMWNNIHRPDGLTLAPDGNIYIGELNAIPGMEGAPNLGHRVSIYDRSGNRLALIGHPDEGEEDGRFIAPHGIAVDSRGDVYVGEVSNTIAGARLGREPKSLKKLVRRP